MQFADFGWHKKETCLGNTHEDQPTTLDLLMYTMSGTRWSLAAIVRYQLDVSRKQTYTFHQKTHLQDISKRGACLDLALRTSDSGSIESSRSPLAAFLLRPWILVKNHILLKAS